MALSVDPATFIIHIPRADMTLVQSSPTEIRELNLNDFRLALKAWEAGGDGLNEGATFLKTHTHNTEVSLGGLTFARTIELLAPYTVTFEDGQYAVNLVGANSNVGDRVNVNQVSVRSQNSAGLISSPDIEFSSFRGGVMVDTVNGVEGTSYPRGTERMPVNNIPDALLIAEYRGFNTIFLNSDMVLGAESVMDDFVIIGKSHVETAVEFLDVANVHGVTIVNCSIQGILDGHTVVKDCVIGDITYMNGHVGDCTLLGEIVLGGGQDAYLADCAQLDLNTIPSVDIGGSGQDLIMADYIGTVLLKNLTGGNKVGIGLAGGTVILDSTITNGTIQASGTGRMTDENGNYITSGTWNGGVTIVNELLNKEEISNQTTDKVIPFIYGK